MFALVAGGAALWMACGTNEPHSGLGPLSGDDAGIGSGGDDGSSPPRTFADMDAAICSAEGSSHPAGCGCSSPGQSVACWTGPPTNRNLGACKDGTQQCVSQSGELAMATWGPCTGEQLDCGSSVDAAPSPPPTGCGCIPGKTISCDEDCSANLFCQLRATKTCLPDGTWGACHEESPDGGYTAYVTGCTNIEFGCAGPGAQGAWIGGDCGSLFTCGQTPPATY
jgi:hypothetical protein